MANGLSIAEAHERLIREGKNRIPQKRKGPIGLFLRQFQSWFVILLLIAAFISFILGETRQVFTIILILVITGFLGFIQEFRHQKIVEKLQNLVPSRAWVRRDGKIQEINKEDLVTGDLVILEKGDIVPADLKLSNSFGLLVDERILTGESKPIEKKEGWADRDILFAGTTIIAGSGEGEVIAKGAETKIGKIAKIASQISSPSILEENVKEISRFIMKLVTATIILVFLGNILLKGWGINIPELLLFISALAIGIVPEALPVVVLATLSTGAAKMAKKKVVVKRLSSIDDFGNIEVLCVDKTGTITENIPKIERLETDNEKMFWRIFLASTAGIKGERGGARDILDRVLLERVPKEERKDNWQVLFRIPFDPSLRKQMAVVKKDREILMIIKGAPEEILRLSELTKDRRKIIEEKIHQEGEEGKRVYALAFKEVKEGEDFASVVKKGGFSFCGFASFTDSIKPSTEKVVDKAGKLGVDIRILTGDTPELALKVGREISLIEGKGVISGFDLEKMSEDESRKVIFENKIFARVTPEQKFQIIRTLKEKFSVGFLGDGVNDAPALRAANVGIAVDSASDVAREAADIVLLEKSLRVIIDGIEEGRKTFLNVMKYIRYKLASNFGNCYTLAIISLFIPFLPLLPAQILLLNLLSDFPLISVAVDNVDEREIGRPQKLDLKETAALIILLGVISSLFDFGFFAIFRNFGERTLQTLWFMESVLSEIVFVFSIRTSFFFLRAKRPAALLLFLSALTSIITIFLPYTFLGAYFYFVRPNIAMVGGVLGIVLLYFSTTELVKLWYYHRLRQVKSLP